MSIFDWVLLVMGVYSFYRGVRGIKEKHITFLSIPYKGNLATIYGILAIAIGVAVIAVSLSPLLKNS